MTFAKSERTELCDLFEQLGPVAPTLCEDWTTHDLAAHLWIRETDPVGAPGILAKPLSGLTERRMAETRDRWSYTELVERIRSGPARFSVFAFPGVDEPANTTEYFVHHEDVRRAGESPLPPRQLDPEVEDWMWRRLKLLGRAFFRRAQVGVTLERRIDDGPIPTGPGSVDADGPPVLRAATGAQIVTIIGHPSELLLYANGRTAAADVRLVGEPEAIDLLENADLSV